MLGRQMANPIKAIQKLQDPEVILKLTPKKSQQLKRDNDGILSTTDTTKQLVEKCLEAAWVYFQLSPWPDILEDLEFN